jgi:hypothetical protein
VAPRLVVSQVEGGEESGFQVEQRKKKLMKEEGSGECVK